MRSFHSLRHRLLLTRILAPSPVPDYVGDLVTLRSVVAGAWCISFTAWVSFDALFSRNLILTSRFSGLRKCVWCSLELPAAKQSVRLHVRTAELRTALSHGY